MHHRCSLSRVVGLNQAAVDLPNFLFALGTSLIFFGGGRACDGLNSFLRHNIFKVVYHFLVVNSLRKCFFF